MVPPTDVQCGKGGASCVSCQGQETCQDGVCYFDGGSSGGDGGFNLDGGFGLCGPSTCPLGCCLLGMICQSPSSNDYCGLNGAECDFCTLQVKLCVAGQCQ
ncbi:MAG: hypothetical protein HYZ28_20175 [Myxococcales bacterium]|nr:hypothetical protein [Myxococcales bacterium]